MFGQTFYFDTIRKYIILVGTLFNDIKIVRTDKDGNVVALIKVPITYSPKDKMLARVMGDPGIDKETAIVLPVIAFEMGQMKYDGSRKLNTLNRVSVKDTDKNKFAYQYGPVPYNIDFKVCIYVKNPEDGTKIIEQILPFFTPDWTTTVKLIPEVDETRDIPVILDNIKCEDKYDGDFKDRRALIWELDLTLKGYIYGPVKKGGIIKFVNTRFYLPGVADGHLQDAVGNTDPSEAVTVQPGLTANGQPTSNIALTIPYNQIEADDDFGYITQIETF